MDDRDDSEFWGAEVTRDDFEAVLWRLLGHMPGDVGVVVDEILGAADAYLAVTLGEIDSYRRSHRVASHLDVGGHPACNGVAVFAGAPLVADPLGVTCRRCRRTTAWQDLNVALRCTIEHLDQEGGTTR